MILKRRLEMKAQLASKGTRDDKKPKEGDDQIVVLDENRLRRKRLKMMQEISSV